LRIHERLIGGSWEIDGVGERSINDDWSVARNSWRVKSDVRYLAYLAPSFNEPLSCLSSDVAQESGCNFVSTLTSSTSLFLAPPLLCSKPDFHPHPTFNHILHPRLPNTNTHPILSNSHPARHITHTHSTTTTTHPFDPPQTRWLTRTISISQPCNPNKADRPL
jgi:hypothetical protein